MTLRRLILLSRPRFWLYELGTFAIGVLAAWPFTEAVSLPLIGLFAGYFLLPANLLIYGINDVYDYETDRRNPKKQGYEDLLEVAQHRPVLVAVAVSSGTFLLLTPLFTPPALAAFLAFIFFAVCYSAPPIRAKARPFFDSLFSAGHYIATGVFGYYLAGGSGEVWWAVGGGMLWAMAMHAYSAVPDIAADTEAGLSTVATWLGRNATIIACAGAYAGAGVVASVYFGWLAYLLLLPYLCMMWLSYRADEAALMRLYTYFPYLNAATGMSITFAVLFVRGLL